MNASARYVRRAKFVTLYRIRPYNLGWCHLVNFAVCLLIKIINVIELNFILLGYIYTFDNVSETSVKSLYVNSIHNVIITHVGH